MAAIEADGSFQADFLTIPEQFLRKKCMLIERWERVHLKLLPKAYQKGLKLGSQKIRT